MRMWLAMLASATALAGCGIFFALQGLGHADQYASIASFFLALLTAIGSLVSLTRSRSEKRDADADVEDRAHEHGRTFYLAWKNKAVQQGDGSVMTITTAVEPQFRKASRRKR